MVIWITTRGENGIDSPLSKGDSTLDREREGDVLNRSVIKDNPLKASPSFPLC